jgi:hypothetical protein
MTKKRNHAEALPNISTFIHFQGSDFVFCKGGLCISEPCKSSDHVKLAFSYIVLFMCYFIVTLLFKYCRAFMYLYYVRIS